MQHADLDRVVCRPGRRGRERPDGYGSAYSQCREYAVHLCHVYLRTVVVCTGCKTAKAVPPATSVSRGLNPFDYFENRPFRVAQSFSWTASSMCSPGNICLIFDLCLPVVII
ncbi:hypothetical protein XM25_11357 [Devosia sp. H5989]|nr:hypothetical protein XM25_11357 [Devosia sp. H5989]